jgi:hypothetical protein
MGGVGLFQPTKSGLFIANDGITAGNQVGIICSDRSFGFLSDEIAGLISSSCRDRARGVQFGFRRSALLKVRYGLIKAALLPVTSAQVKCVFRMQLALAAACSRHRSYLRQ